MLLWEQRCDMLLRKPWKEWVMNLRSNGLLLIFMFGHVAFIGIFLTVVYIYKPIASLPDLLMAIPGPVFSDVSIIIFLPHVLVPLVSIALASVLIRMYTKLGPWMKLGQYEVGLYNYAKTFRTPELIGRALYAAYFSLTLGLMANQFFLSAGTELVVNSTASSILVLTLLFSPIAAVIQAPMWWTEDVGIMLIRKTDRESVAPDISSVGRFMNVLTRGFITVSTPVLYISTLVKEIHGLKNIIPLLLMILFPLALVGYFIPFQCWFAKRFLKFKGRLLPHLKLRPVNVKCNLE